MKTPHEGVFLLGEIPIFFNSKFLCLLNIFVGILLTISKPTKMKKLTILSLISFLLCTVSFANEDEITRTYELNGKVTLDDKRGNDVVVRLYQGNELVAAYTTDWTGKFFLNLAAGELYTLELEKSGFITKRVAINTEAKDLNANIAQYRFELNLIPEEYGQDYSELDFPIAILKLDERNGEFKSIERYRNQMVRIEERVLKNNQFAAK